MSEADFRSIQYAFTAHLRNPHQVSAPQDVEDRRLAIYRRLLYNNVEGFMANAFPVIRMITEDAAWHALVRDYFAHHQARTPLFPRMPQEFLHFLADVRNDPADPPFLRELAHYEWLEAEVLFDSREVDAVTVDENFDVEHGSMIANPVLRPQVYAFAVHRISTQYLPTAAPPEPTYLVVFRRRDDSAGFMELNAVSARLLELIIANDGRSAHSLLLQIAAELAHPDPAVIINGGRSILRTFLDKEIILGSIAAGH